VIRRWRERALPEVPADWKVERSEGWGPFRTRVTWRLPDGSAVTWTSRWARKRGSLHVRSDGAESVETRGAPEVAGRLRLVNWIASVAFTIGGSLFAAGAAVDQWGSGSSLSAASIYFAGGLFFNTGGYSTLLQAINAPRGVGRDGSPRYASWRWWSYEPEHIDWVSALTLFAGTIVFGINLLDSFLQGLTVHQVNRLIWAPDVIGCFLFLISGHLALKEVCHGRLRVIASDLGWWVAALNQLGSYLFLVSALGAYTRPETSSEVNVWIANIGTLTGALCFAVGGVLQAFEQPEPEAAPVEQPAPG